MKHNIRRVLEDIRLKRKLRLDAFEKLKDDRKKSLTSYHKHDKIYMGLGGYRSDDDIWRTTDDGHKIMFNEKGVVTGGNAYAVQKMKQGGAKVSSSAKTKKLTPKKESASENITSAKSSSSASSTTKMSAGLEKTLQALPPEVQEKHRIASEISQDYYKKGREMTEDFSALRSFTDHNGLHIDQVCEKTIAAVDTIDECLKDDPNYGPIDRAEALVAARMHDVGMDGDTTNDYTGTDGNALRKEHSVNSGMHVLENRGALEQAGIDPDRVAFAVFAHSKSSSGLSDLNDPKCWEAALNKMEEFVEKHNANPNSTGDISFDRHKFDDPEARASMRSVIAALRFGDANRDAPEGDANMTQGGGVIKVDTSKFDKSIDYGSKEAERALFETTVTYPDGRVEHSGTDHFDKSRYSAGVYVGEGNLSKINCVKGKNGEVMEEFHVKDGNMAPHCTFDAINERIGEMATATGIPRAVAIKMPAGMSRHEVERVVEIYRRDLQQARYDAIDKGKKDPYRDIDIYVATADGGEIQL